MNEQVQASFKKTNIQPGAGAHLRIYQKTRQAHPNDAVVRNREIALSNLLTSNKVRAIPTTSNMLSSMNSYRITIMYTLYVFTGSHGDPSRQIALDFTLISRRPANVLDM